jgi:hypothetical protein
MSRGEVVFQVESDFFPGKFVEVGEDSTIKERSVLKCFVKRPIDFDKHPVSMLSTDKRTENQTGNNKKFKILLYIFYIILFCS